MAKNRDKQEILRSEILRVLPSKNSDLTADNMKNMPYLRACIKESLRIYPIGTGTIRTISQDLVLSNYRVPKNTEVAMMNLNLLMDPNHYPQPRSFIPERWLRPTENTQQCAHQQEEATKSKHPFVYLPFGFGPRSCIGRRIAEMELEIGICRILRNFEVEFNYPTHKAFKGYQINVPAIPLKFKFTDLTY